MFGNRIVPNAWWASALLCASLPWATSAASTRKPLGVYAHVDIGDAIGSYPGSATPTLAQLHSYLRSLYASLLAAPAISGLTVGAHWDQTQPANAGVSSDYDWSYLDDAFAAAVAANKSVQLIITPGFDSPPWLLAEIPSCDPLFTTGSAPSNCGTVTFVGYPEAQRSDGNVLPLPWNSVYQAAWGAFLTSLNARYNSNSAFVAIAIAGPVGASDEMIFPTSTNDTATQPSGLAVDATWAALIQHSFPSTSAYQNTDQVFIDAWQQAIDASEKIFAGVTLFIGADAGNDFPNFSQNVTPHVDNTLFAQDCSASPKSELMSCEAKTEVLSYFVTVAGPNGKATQVGGMTASSPATIGDIGVPGVKLLTALTPAPSTPFLGGAEFDQPVSGPSTLQSEGCPNPNGGCTGLTVEEAAYNVMTVFFSGTPVAAFYSGTLGTATIQFLDVPFNDIQYALANTCPTAPNSNIGYMSLQDLYSRASHDLFAMANQPAPLPPLTCMITPTISLVANAEGEEPTIAPNTWVEIKGLNLAPVGDSRVWQGSDFLGNQMPTQLDQVSVTVNGKSAYVYYISPTQINILTPPDAMQGTVAVQVTNNLLTGPAFSVQAQVASPSFFVVNGGPYVLAQHGGTVNLIGPANLYSGSTTPAKPGETVVLYANGFGAISPAVVSGASSQTGTLTPLPTVTIGGIAAHVAFAGINGPPGLFQFNVVVPANAPNGDNPLIATYNGSTTSPQALFTIQGSTPSTSDTFYVATNGNDSWSGTLAAPNPANTDGPFATFDRARAAVQKLNKTGLSQVTIQFRGGSYFLPATEMFTAADSGSGSLQIVYRNYPGESPVISGGMPVQNWTNVSGNMWKTTLPASTQYFENLFYNGVRRLRPRLGGTSSGQSLGTYHRYVGPVYLSGPAPPASPPEPNCSEYFAGSGWECFDRFQYSPTDPIVSTWKNLAPPAGNPCGQPAGNPALAGDIELVNFEQYSVSKLRISCVDTAHQLVYLTGDTATEADHPTAHGFIPNHRYLIENIEDELTQPGQWFLDRSTTPWTLTYLANPGENPNTDTVIVPQLTQVLVASNLQYVTFQGLTFEHDNYTMPATGYDGDTDIIAGVSFQNSQHITVDSSIVAQTSGVGLEFISCIDKTSLNWCVSNSAAGVTANNLIENSAFYELAADGIRIGTSGSPSDTNANVPQFNTIQNTVVEGYGRVYASSKGIAQGQGHDNLYTHNDVYDGYKGAIKVCYCANSDVNPPFTNNNIISFNHVYNLFQGIMNDSGSLYFGVGTPSPPSSGTGNKMLNNKVHDVNDASVMDSDGYGGDGLYADDFSGLVDMENNLVYRVSGNAISFSGPRAGPNQSSTVKNNILAFARQSLLNAYDPYSFNTEPPQPMFFTASNNLFYFDRTSAESFYAQGGCTYPGAITYTAYQQWTSNLYWRTDGEFATDPQAFHVQQSLDANGGCANQKLWTYFTFAGWQKLAEDAQSVVQNPLFNSPGYPADDYTLPKGPPGVGFVVFDPSQAGRSNPAIKPPTVPATFPTKTFNPATDF